MRCSLVVLLALSLFASCSLPPSRRGDVQEDAARRLDQELVLPPEDAEGLIDDIMGDRRIDIDEAVRLAICNNRKLLGRLEALEIGRARLLGASLLPNPVVDAELTFVEAGGGEILELTVAQNVIDALLIPIRRQVAGERLAQIEAEVTGAILDLAVETRETYRRLQAQHDLVALYASAAEATGLSAEAARRLHEAGNILAVDAFRERALFEETRIALASARSRMLALREDLCLLLGLWGEAAQGWSIEPALPPPEALDVDPSGIESQAIERSLDLKAARHHITALGHQAGLERIEALFPEGAVGAKADREPDDTWAVGPVAALSLPVFDFGQAVDAEALARLRRATALFSDLAVRIRASVRAAWVEASTAAESSRFAREVVLPLRGRITAETQLQFNAMQVGVFRLLDAKSREIAAGRRYVESLRDHWIARARLESILMGRLPGGDYGLEMGPSGSAGSAMAADGGGGH